MSPVASPAPRSTSIRISRGVMSTSERSRWAPPARHTSTPLTLTDRSSTAKGARASGTHPAAETIRPQLGSLPKIAALTRLERAISRATASAAASVVAERTTTCTSWLAPSASATSWRARSALTARTASVSSRMSGATPLAPEAIRITVSLVDMQASESTRSKVAAVASRSTASAVSASMSASVVRTTSMVASCGASIPAPLAMPPTRTPESVVRSAVLGTVSVVMIALAAAASGSAPAASRVAPVVMPASSVCIGRRSPIRPVEQTSTSWAETSSVAAKCSAVRRVSARPSGPVQALAPPEFRTTARARPSATASRDQITGAAWTRLAVNTAAALWRGPSLTIRVRSVAPVDFSPAARPAARKPRGRVIDTGLLEGCGAEKVQDRPEPEPGLGLGPGPGSGSQSGPAQPHALIQTQRQVQRLDGGTGRALDQVVQGRDDSGLTAAFVYEGTDADGVGTGGLPGGGEGALLEQGHEVLLSIVGVQRSEEVGGGDLAAHPCGADRQDASAHRHQHRGEGQPGVLMSRRTAQVLQDLGNVPVAAADRVGSRGAGALGEHQMLFGGASGSRVADLQHRAERGRVDQLCPHERRQGEGDGGGVAAGHGDLARAGQQLALRGAVGERQLGHPVGPGAGVLAAVVVAPVLFTLEAVVGSEVEDQQVRIFGAELGGDPAGLPVGKRQDHDVMAPQGLGGGLGQDRVVAEVDVRGHLAEPLAGARVRGDRGDLDARMRAQQAQRLLARVPGGPDDGRAEGAAGRRRGGDSMRCGSHAGSIYTRMHEQPVREVVAPSPRLSLDSYPGHGEQVDAL